MHTLSWCAFFALYVLFELCALFLENVVHFRNQHESSCGLDYAQGRNTGLRGGRRIFNFHSSWYPHTSGCALTWKSRFRVQPAGNLFLRPWMGPLKSAEGTKSALSANSATPQFADGECWNKWRLSGLQFPCFVCVLSSSHRRRWFSTTGPALAPRNSRPPVHSSGLANKWHSHRRMKNISSSVPSTALCRSCPKLQAWSLQQAH